MSGAGLEEKLLEVNESISIDFKDFGLNFLTSTNERHCIRASCYFLGLHCPAAHLFCPSQSITSKPNYRRSPIMYHTASQLLKSNNPPNSPALQTCTLHYL